MRGKLKIRCYNTGEINESQMRYAVIATRYGDKWVFVQHKERSTWEMPGGRRESGESIVQTARRELFEETGAVRFRLQGICDYSVTRPGSTGYGRLFFAEVEELGPLPDCEIAQIALARDFPGELTYPEVQPILLKLVQEHLTGIVEVSEAHLGAWVELALALWPDHSRQEMEALCLAILASERETALLYTTGGKYVGFINLSVRVDYVEGSDSSPVGYVEGIYVQEGYRKQGIAKQLVAKGETWARAQGCTQIGSDIELHNAESYSFHTSVGFQEANRIICFIKDLKGS